MSLEVITTGHFRHSAKLICRVNENPENIHNLIVFSDSLAWLWALWIFWPSDPWMDSRSLWRLPYISLALKLHRFMMLKSTATPPTPSSPTTPPICQQYPHWMRGQKYPSRWCQLPRYCQIWCHWRHVLAHRGSQRIGSRVGPLFLHSKCNTFEREALYHLAIFCTL